MSEINQEIQKAVSDGVKAIAMSIASQDSLTELSSFKKKQNEKSGRNNYCKTVLLLWGILSFYLDELDDAMFNRVLMFSLSVLNPILNKKQIKPYYPGVDLSPGEDKNDYSNLSYEMHNWFTRNDTKPGVQTLITTGKHLFSLMALKDRLSDQHIEKFYDMGSLIERDTNGMGVMKSVLMDNNIKLNF